jgi:hypothetical protein
LKLGLDGALAVTYSVYRIDQLLPADLVLRGPISELVLFGKADQIAIRVTALVRVVGHRCVPLSVDG